MRTQLQDQIDQLDRMARRLDDRDLEAVVSLCRNVLEAGGRLVFAGLGKTVPVCEKVVGTLTSVGLPAAFLHANTAVHGDLGLVGARDLVVILSKSGETEESLWLARELKARETGSLALVCREDSSLAELADRTLVLPLEREEGLWDLLPVNSSLGYLWFLQGLVLQLVEDLGIRKDVFLANHPGGMIGRQGRMGPGSSGS